MTANGCDKNILKLDCDDTCTILRITTKNQIAYFKWMNVMVCALYLKAVII